MARRLPKCGYTVDGQTCTKSGSHFCLARSERVAKFFAEALVHTKGRWARQPFALAPWQRTELVDPIFGPAAWSEEWETYRRQITQADIELARKQGKSEFDAGVALLLICADDEESAEVYGCARDRDQARKVYDVAERMVELSSVLSKRLEVKSSAKRIIDPRTASYYEVIPADAAGNLGHNPHGVVLDEMITQRDGGLWDALRTATGTRVQSLLLRSTTAGDDPSSWAKKEHDESAKVTEDPKRTPHRYVFLRNTPADADPWDEANWHFANPALGDFLSIEALRREASEAKADPTKENAWRQFRLNQWVQQTTRYVPLHLWDECAGEVWPSPEWRTDRLAGKRCYAGLDLSSKLDLTAWCLLFDDGWAWWRYWLPEDAVKPLDDATGGQVSQWAKAGWITLTDGNTIDYDRVYADIETDHKRFAIADVTYDPWAGEPVRQEVTKRTGVEMTPLKQTYDGMTAPMQEFMRMLLASELGHGANPVARWHADALEAKRPTDDADRIRPVKPERHASARRIDGMVALFMAIDGRMRRGGQVKKKYGAFSF